ncbi:uncharacterized protein LOC122847805 [Aphidius gifuensis]|uniref:uncharacterized protein LOC122847805 n=1 Tax=Aphidius gifuensis TaxID=684658 RepID=UPI001CDD6CE2|nr:uncharacterized protein LOC122847805 [Aphidius gifuensis]
MEIITRQSLMCLKNLQHLTIAESNLTFIAPGAFGVLKKLKTLSLISNVKLTYIPANVFNIRSLDIIDLRIFQNIKCSVIDFTHSKIVAVVDEAFNTSQIDTIYFYKNQFFDINIGKWGIDYYTTMIYFNYQISDFAIGFNEKKNPSAWAVSNFKIETTCEIKEWIIEICKNHKSISSVKSSTDVTEYIFDILPWTVIDKVEINVNDIQSISKHAFKQSPLKNQLKTLIIYNDNEKYKIDLYPESFEGLTKLENLELNVGPILIKNNLFSFLPSLKYLKIKPYELNNVYISQVIMKLKNLKTLEIVGNNSIGICQNLYSKMLPKSIIDIRYKTGFINSLEKNSLNCLIQIESLSITETSLGTINVDLFLFNNTGFVEVNKAWGISQSTYVHINEPTHEVMYCKLRSGKRIDCKHCEKSVKCILVSLRFG